MCMSIEYHLYLVKKFYYVNVFLFMGGSTEVVMLLLCYLSMTMIIILILVVLYSMYNLIIV